MIDTGYGRIGGGYCIVAILYYMRWLADSWPMYTVDGV